MTSIRRITILRHERCSRRRYRRYMASYLAKVWRAQGIRVDEARGTDHDLHTDLLFPQIDLSVVPQSYVEYFEGFARVVNRRVTDIRKSVFSENRLAPDDDWPGRVIVKTNRNYGGRPEEAIKGGRVKELYWWLRSHWAWGTGRDHDSATDLASTSVLDPYDYPLFDRLSEVPAEVFENPALVVERFLEERSERGYVLRSYNFLGDRFFTRLRVSDHPIVRAYNSRQLAPPPLPDQLLELRQKLGIDYGKFDYVVFEGKPVVLDVNTTPTIVPQSHNSSFLASLQDLASGIHAFG